MSNIIAFKKKWYFNAQNSFLAGKAWRNEEKSHKLLCNVGFHAWLELPKPFDAILNVSFFDAGFSCSIWFKIHKKHEYQFWRHRHKLGCPKNEKYLKVFLSLKIPNGWKTIQSIELSIGTRTSKNCWN